MRHSLSQAGCSRFRHIPRDAAAFDCDRRVFQVTPGRRDLLYLVPARNIGTSEGTRLNLFRLSLAETTILYPPEKAKNEQTDFKEYEPWPNRIA